MTDFSFNGNRGEIVGRRWYPEDDPAFVVLLAHGYGEHAGRYEHVAKALTDAGAAVWAPDHWGHGRSGGDRALVEGFEAIVDDLAHVYKLAHADHPNLPVILIGHSMGGLIATLYAQQRGDTLAALVLSGPVVGGNPDLFALLEHDEIPEVPIDPAVLSRDPNVGDAYLADNLVYHGGFARATLQSFVDSVKIIGEGPPLQVPTLWIHGENDPLAPLKDTRAAMEHLQPTEEKVYEGAKHEIFNETNQDEVIGDTVAFIEKILNVNGEE